MTKKILFFLLTSAIIIGLAKTTYPYWLSIAVYGFVIFLWGYFLRGIIDKK